MSLLDARTVDLIRREAVSTFPSTLTILEGTRSSDDLLGSTFTPLGEDDTPAYLPMKCRLHAMSNHEKAVAEAKLTVAMYNVFIPADRELVTDWQVDIDGTVFDVLTESQIPLDNLRSDQLTERKYILQKVS